MRALFAAIGGAFAGIVVGMLVGPLLLRPEPEGRPEPARAAIQDGGETARLRARVAELEAALADAGPAADPAGDGATSTSGDEAASTEVAAADLTPEALSALIEEKRLADLGAALGELLRSGEPGFATILDFLRQVSRPPSHALWTNRGVQHAILAAVFRNEDAAGEFARFFLARHDPAADTMLRDHLLGFLAPFLAYGGDRFSSLREDMESVLTGDLAAPGQPGNLWRTVQHLQELGVQVPVETYESILADGARKQDHAMAVYGLTSRGDEAAADALLRFVASAENPADGIVQQALHALGRNPSPAAQRAIESWISSPVKELRSAAVLAYFGQGRGAEAAPIALGYLTSDVDANQKRMLLWNLGASSPDALEAVRNEVAAGSAPEVKDLVEKHVQAMADQKAKWAAAQASGGAWAAADAGGAQQE